MFVGKVLGTLPNKMDMFIMTDLVGGGGNRLPHHEGELGRTPGKPRAPKLPLRCKGEARHPGLTPGNP